jgi:small-conductance mechanosensitive channel
MNFLLPTQFAAIIPPLWRSLDDCKNTGTSCNLNSLTILAGNIANIAITIIGTIALVYLIYAGIMYMTSGGNPEKVEKAKSMIFYGILGLALAILSYSIVGYIIDIVS